MKPGLAHGAVVVTTLVLWAFGLAERVVSSVGDMPQALPPLTMAGFAPDLSAQSAMRTAWPLRLHRRGRCAVLRGGVDPLRRGIGHLFGHL